MADPTSTGIDADSSSPRTSSSPPPELGEGPGEGALVGRDRAGGERICVVMLTGLGDVVNALPLVNALKDDDPSRHVTWVVEPMAAPILRPHPSVDEVVVYRKKDGVGGVWELARALRGRRFDVTLNLNVYFKSVWPTVLSGARRRIGFGRDRAFEGIWLTATETLPPRPRRHPVDMFLEFAEQMGVPVGEPEWRISFTEEERRERDAFFAELDRPLVVIPPATANRKKDWPAERWARVIDALEHDFGFRVALTGGTGERETHAAREIVERTGAEPLLEMGGPIRRMAWLVGGADLVIGADTGPIHVARAQGTPVIGLYGHTNPWRVGPYERYQELWVDTYTDPGEAPDPSLFDARLGRMELITVDDVLDRVQRAVDRYGVGRGART